MPTPTPAAHLCPVRVRDEPERGTNPKGAAGVASVSADTIRALQSLPPPGTGYFVAPTAGPGPGVLLVPSPWGLTASFKRRADELAEAGFTVLAPDLNDGRVAASEDEATEALMGMDMNVSASLVQSSLRLLKQATVDPTEPVGVVGFAAGASWAFWLSERLADDCRAVAGFYGTQSIPFVEAKASYLLHIGSEDELVSDDEVAMLGLNLQLAKRPQQVTRHDGAAHGFAEFERPTYHATAEAVAWRQTLEFLAEHLRPGRPS